MCPNAPYLRDPNLDTSESNAGGKTTDLQSGVVQQGQPDGVTVEAPELMDQLRQDVKNRE